MSKEKIMDTSERESAILDAVEAIRETVHAATARQRANVRGALKNLRAHEAEPLDVDGDALLGAARMAVDDLAAATMYATVEAMLDQQAGNHATE